VVRARVLGARVSGVKVRGPRIRVKAATNRGKFAPGNDFLSLAANQKLAE